MSEEKYVVGPDDPRRCKGMMSSGQCTIEALPGKEYCKMHLQGPQITEKRETIKNLRLGQWQSRVDEKAINPNIKSLREEIAVLRMALEELINMCVDSAQLVAMSNKIADLILKIEKLVVSCHHLEKSSGMLLDKSAALHLAGNFIEIIGKHCTDPDVIAAISDDMVKALDALEPAIDPK